MGKISTYSSELAKQTVEGTFTATGESGALKFDYPGTFNATLSGTFVGTVALRRSFDGGTTYHPVTVFGETIYEFTAPCSETGEEHERGMLWRFECTAYTSGTITYRLSK